MWTRRLSFVPRFFLASLERLKPKSLHTVITKSFLIVYCCTSRHTQYMLTLFFMCHLSCTWHTKQLTEICPSRTLIFTFRRWTTTILYSVHSLTSRVAACQDSQPLCLLFWRNSARHWKDPLFIPCLLSPIYFFLSVTTSIFFFIFGVYMSMNANSLSSTFVSKSSRLLLKAFFLMHLTYLFFRNYFFHPCCLSCYMKIFSITAIPPEFFPPSWPITSFWYFMLATDSSLLVSIKIFTQCTMFRLQPGSNRIHVWHFLQTVWQNTWS